MKGPPCWGCQGVEGLLGTHCKGGSRRLVLEVGTLYRAVPAGCLCCTVSGHRLPWLRRADQEGHTGEAWWKERWLSLLVELSSFPWILGSPSFSPWALCFHKQRQPLRTSHIIVFFPPGTKVCFLSSVQSDSPGSGLHLTRCGWVCGKPSPVACRPSPLLGQQWRSHLQ